ncbi:hypothetical protein BZG36_02134 [Bifiguratus adelaidae]|uniref:N-formylglutamate amidohydrolase n=1 Tax=Bifiguratus adelaidae TaxID=1938954 RepID=A0A261Y392_9FUNG|nr:hypothetical protein BZG36_02134 [Bifiguratus adelaidae]
MGLSRSDPNYVTFHHGTLPLIIAAPHGGQRYPRHVKNRPSEPESNTKPDLFTREMALSVAHGVSKVWQERGGTQRPFVVVCDLARRKVDVNREWSEEVGPSPEAKATWKAYHGALNEAVEAVQRQFGAGLYLDLHGHAHPTNWIELGYNIPGPFLRLDDEALDELEILRQNTSIYGLLERTDMSLSEGIRGNRSFGHQWKERNTGFEAVPSPQLPWPLPNDVYFKGGYSIQRHGSAHRKHSVDAIQVEMPRLARLHVDERAKVVAGLVDTVVWMLDQYYN